MVSSILKTSLMTKQCYLSFSLPQIGHSFFSSSRDANVCQVTLKLVEVLMTQSRVISNIKQFFLLKRMLGSSVEPL